MTNMPDYLLGGSDPLMDELADDFVLDEGGPLREYMFGRLKTDLQGYEEESEEKFNRSVPIKKGTFPSFLYYDALK